MAGARFRHRSLPAGYPRGAASRATERAQTIATRTLHRSDLSSGDGAMEPLFRMLSARTVRRLCMVRPHARGDVDAGRAMNALGINQATSGNISVRWRDGLLITPSGLPYDRMTAGDIVPMKLDGAFEHRLKP